MCRLFVEGRYSLVEGVIVNVFQAAINRKSKENTCDRLLEDIDLIKDRIEAVQSHFEELTDSDLIEANIYEMKSLNARYRYLLREAKRTGAFKDKQAVIEAVNI